jgi:hypothetical protein
MTTKIIGVSDMHPVKKIKSENYEPADILPLRNKPGSASGNDGGGGMNLEQRVERLEEKVDGLRMDVAEIKATLPFLATKAEIMELKAELKSEVQKSANITNRWGIGIVIAIISLVVAVFFKG